MKNKELEWIKNVVEKLQQPQTYNERQRLIKILETVAPALIKVVDYTAVVEFGSCVHDDNEVKPDGHTCNGCGQDHYFDEGNAKHYTGGTRENPDAQTPCCVEDLFLILKGLEETEDK